MQHALDRANRLIDDLVDITRTEAGKQLPISPRPLDLRRLVESVCSITSPRATEASISLAVDIEPDLPPALADEPRIGQVLENLLSNALKFTSRGGHVNIRARRETDHILIAVRDDGPGMTPDQVEHAFDRFWQASASDARGAGLGLAISRAIVEAHHGRIWATSMPGAGSTFWFTLPIGEELPHSHALREAG
jgi:signal transduction histidine kinase